MAYISILHLPKMLPYLHSKTWVDEKHCFISFYPSLSSGMGLRQSVYFDME